MKISLNRKTAILLICIALLVLYLAIPCPKTDNFFQGVKEPPQGAPDFIKTVRPLPDSRLSFSCILRSNCLGNVFPVFAQEGSIVASISDGAIVNDEYCGDKNLPPVDQRVFFYINGIKRQARLIMAHGMVLRTDTKFCFGGLDPEVAAGYYFYYPAMLLPGKHTVKVSIETRTGRVFEYEWRFTITP